MNTRVITEGALITALTIIIALISYYVPFFSALIYFLVPIPTIIFYKRYGGIPAVLECLASSILLLFFMGFLNALLLASNIVFPGLLLGYSYYNEKSGETRIISGYIGYLITIIIELAVAQIITGVPFVEDFINEMNSITQSLTESYRAAGLLDGTQGEALLENIETFKQTFEMLLPTIVLCIPLLMSWCSVLVNDLFFKRIKLKYKPLKPITEWKINTFSKNILAITTIIVVLLGYMITDPAFEIYIFTLETIITGFYTIMGFVFIFWLIQVKFNTKFFFLRISVVICCIVFSILMSFVTLLGVFDVYFNIRRFVKVKE